jgi:hypothetical protein
MHIGSAGTVASTFQFSTRSIDTNAQEKFAPFHTYSKVRQETIMIATTRIDVEEEHPSSITMNNIHKTEEAVCCVREELERTMATLHPNGHKHDDHHDDHHEQIDWLGEPEAETAAIATQQLQPGNRKALEDIAAKSNTVHQRPHVTKHDHHGLLSQAYVWM